MELSDSSCSQSTPFAGLDERATTCKSHTSVARTTKRARPSACYPSSNACPECLSEADTPAQTSGSAAEPLDVEMQEDEPAADEEFDGQAVLGLISGLFSVVAEIQQVTNEVSVRAKERQATYERERNALREENDALKKRLEAYNQGSSSQSESAVPTQDEAHSLVTQQYEELVRQASSALSENQTLMYTLESSKAQLEKVQSRLERERSERASGEKMQRLIEDNTTLRSTLDTLHVEYEQLQHDTGTNLQLATAHHNYAAILREREWLRLDKARLGVEMENVVRERNRMRFDLLRAEKEGYARRAMPAPLKPGPKPQPQPQPHEVQQVREPAVEERRPAVEPQWEKIWTRVGQTRPAVVPYGTVAWGPILIP